MTKIEFILVAIFYFGSLLAVLFIALKLQKLRASNQVDTIEMKDETIEKEIINMPLNQLIDKNNTSPDDK